MCKNVNNTQKSSCNYEYFPYSVDYSIKKHIVQDKYL